LNRHEKESFVKSFAIFFGALLTISAIALWLYHNEQKRFYDLHILGEMDAFSYSLRGENFSYAILPMDKTATMHTLVVEKGAVYALFPWSENPREKMIKVTYPHEQYLRFMEGEEQKVIIVFMVMMVIIALLAGGFAHYTLSPMRQTIAIMEDFLKDIIHDLNTPITSILLNAQLLKRKYADEEIERIYLSGQTVSGLYKNLEVLYRELPLEQEEVRVDTFLQERRGYFQNLYPSLTLIIERQDEVSVKINRDILMRIIDNLLSNACKYNHPNGQVSIRYDQTSIEIIDTGIGIKHLDKVFHRFYKESERGLGMGLHIVKTLADRVGIAIEIESQKGIGTHVRIHFLR